MAKKESLVASNSHIQKSQKTTWGREFSRSKKIPTQDAPPGSANTPRPLRGGDTKCHEVERIFFFFWYLIPPPKNNPVPL